MRWVEAHDAEHGVFAWLRVDPTDQGPPGAGRRQRHADTAVQLPTRRPGCRPVGRVAQQRRGEYGGGGLGNFGGCRTAPLDSHDHHQSVVLTAPPLGVVALAPERRLIPPLIRR